VALIKLRRVLERDEAKCDFKARLDYLKRHWPKRIKKTGHPASPKASSRRAQTDDRSERREACYGEEARGPA
jgi:hypothetical protein